MRNFALTCAASTTALMIGNGALAGGHEEELAFSVANVIAELNDTDGDLGFHALIDGEPWKLVEIRDPSDSRILRIRPTGELRNQGLTELFFESAEPEFDELSPEAFFERFPEGIYEISGVSVEGEEMESEAVFSHVMPAPAEIVSPGEADCDDPIFLPGGLGVVIEWEAVTMSHPELGRADPGIEIAGYEVAIEREDGPPLQLNFKVGPDVTSVVAPADLVSPGGVYKFEVLTQEATGNQTAIESCFELSEL